MGALSTLVRSSQLIGIALATTALLGVSAQAAVITSMSGGTSIVMPASNDQGAGPFSNPGYTYTSTVISSVHGFTLGYGLDANGTWDAGLGSPYIGLNADNGSMRMTFDTPVESVLAFVNYARTANGDYYGGPASIAVYDSSNALIESFVLSFSTSGNNLGFDFGFSEGSAIIKSIEFTNSYIVATNLRVDGQTVPEPGTLALLGAALAAMAFGRRRPRGA